MTNLVNAGVSTNDAMAVSGHRTRAVFDRYKIGSAEQTRKALRTVSPFTTDAPRPGSIVSIEARR